MVVYFVSEFYLYLIIFIISSLNKDKEYTNNNFR